jgi:large subunit ribosomal protein L25
MKKENFVVSAESRNDQGKGASRRLRLTGQVPAVLYGGGEAPVSLSLSLNEIGKRLKVEAFYSHLLTLELGGTTQTVVLKDLQRHPVRGEPIHIDFLRVRADKELRMQVPLHFVGGDVAPGVKIGGGVLETILSQVEVECLPKDLPEFIKVDLSAMELGDALHLSQLQLGDGVALTQLKHENDLAVVTLHLPRVVEEEPVAAAEGSAEVPATSQKAPAAGAAPAAKKDEKKKK